MQLRFVTYNIHKGRGMDRKYDLGRIIKICQGSEADCLALQEVTLNMPRSKKEDMASLIAKDLGMAYALGLNVHLKRGSYGNAIFSRFPIVQKENLDLSLSMKKKRGSLLARLQLPKQQILVFNFHLGLSAFERRRQIQKILEYIENNGKDKSFSQLPRVLLGDSNDSKHKLNPIVEKNNYKDTALLSSKGSKSLIHTFPSYAPLLRLDKIFISSHWNIISHQAIRNKMTRISSDHLPVLTELELML